MYESAESTEPNSKFGNFSAVFNSRPVAENKADSCPPPPSQQSLGQPGKTDPREEKKSSIESLHLIDSSSKQARVEIKYSKTNLSQQKILFYL